MKYSPKYLIVTDKGKVLAKAYYKLTAMTLRKKLRITTKEKLNIIFVEHLEQFRKLKAKEVKK